MSATARLLLINKDNSRQLHRTVDGGLLHRCRCSAQPDLGAV